MIRVTVMPRQFVMARLDRATQQSPTQARVGGEWCRYSLLTISLFTHAHSAARTCARDGTRGEGAPAWRLHCKVAPHRRSHTASEGLHSTLFQPPGRSGRSAGGVGEETPGTDEVASRRRLSLTGPRPARAPFPPHAAQAVQTTPPRGKGWGMTSRLNSYCQGKSCAIFPLPASGER